MPGIQAIEAGYYRIPLATTLTDSTHGEMRDFELNTVRLRDMDGLDGVGYTITTGRNGAAVDAILRRDIPEQIAGQDPDRIEWLWQKVWWGQHYGGRGGPVILAMSALDMALWDLKAKRLDQPLWKLLGGHDPQVPCYAGGIDLLLPLDQLLRQTDDNLARGFRAIKMKVGRDRLSEDVERVRAMRQHLGDGFPLMVDANMKWSADEAISAARALQPYAPVWLEEPVVPEDLAGGARVAREGGLPIASGENVHTLAEFKQLMVSGGVTYPEPDVTICGGITVFMKVAHLAEAYHLPVTSHGAHDVTVHLLGAVPNRSYLEVHGFGLDRFIAEPLRIENGFARAPDRPGHGVDFDWNELMAVRA